MDHYTTMIVFRVGTALITSATVGLERESHGRAAGLRTTILVGVAASVAMVLSEMPYQSALANGVSFRPDPARLAAGVLTGMGFLGAGTIMKEGNIIRGVTTAATLWLVAILGLAFGAGEFQLGLLGWIITLITLFALPRVEYMVKNDWYGGLTLVVDITGITPEEVRQRVLAHGVHVQQMQLDYDIAQQTRTMMIELKYKRQDLFRLSQLIMGDLMKAPGVRDLKWR